MPACSNNATIREVTAATIPSPNSRATTRASLGLMSEATVPQRTREVRTKLLCKANRLHSSTADKAPQHASLSSPSSAKHIPCGKAKGLSLIADSVAYAASAPKGSSKVLTAKLGLKHYSVLIPSVVIKGAGHRPMRDPKEPLRWII